jgi:hypothetical protein
MNRKLREKLDSWDLKSVFLTIICFAVGLFIFFYFTDIRDRFRTDDQEDFTGQSIGKVIRVEKIDRIAQSKWKGTNIYTDSYRVSYRFRANGQEFDNTDVIPVTIKNEKLLEEILTWRSGSICHLKFDEEDPSRSVLIETR